MHISQPLLSTNPELIVLEFPGFREYRVENWRLARDGSRRIIWGVSGWTLWDTVMALIVSIVWPWVIDHYWRLTATCFLVAYFVWSRLTQIVSESVIILPPHGIQLETHRGVSSFRLTATRRFIPFALLQDVLINEGLRRWDVRYYLAAVKRTSHECYSVEVAFENILPHYPVLRQVYQGIHELLFTAIDLDHPDPQISN